MDMWPWNQLVISKWKAGISLLRHCWTVSAALREGNLFEAAACRNFVGTEPEELGSVLYGLSYTYVHQKSETKCRSIFCEYSIGSLKHEGGQAHLCRNILFCLQICGSFPHWSMLEERYMVTCHAANISDFLMCLGSNIHRHLWWDLKNTSNRRVIMIETFMKCV